MRVWAKKGGWAYTAGRGQSVVTGWHRDKDRAEALARGYEERTGHAELPDSKRRKIARARAAHGARGVRSQPLSIRATNSRYAT